MKQDFLEKVRAFDPNTFRSRKEIDDAMELLSDFRVKYPFAENPQKIEDFSPDDIFKEKTDEVGDFFHWLEYYLKPIGHLQYMARTFIEISESNLKISKTCSVSLSTTGNLLLKR